MRLLRVVLSVAFALNLLAGVCSAGPVTRLYLTPGHLSVRPNMQQKFEVYGLDAFDNEVPITEPLTWSTQTNAGTITQTGQFTASNITGRYMQGVKVTTPSGLTGLAIVTVSAPSAAGGYIFERSWGDFIPGDQRSCDGMSFGPNGSIMVGDFYSNKIVEYSPAGAYLNQIGPLYNYHVQFSPYSFASSSTNIYVGIRGGVLVFDTAGKYITQYGSYGTNVGQFGYVWDVGVDKYGNIYANDCGNSRIHKFSSTGALLLSFGSSGTGNGQLSNYFAMCVDSNGYIYVVDGSGNRIQKFSPSGVFMAKWTTFGPDNQQLSGLGGMTSDAAGNIYVTSDFGSIFKLSASDAKITRLSKSFDHLSGVLVDAAGNMYVGEYDYDKFTAWVSKFDPQGNLIATWGNHRRNGLKQPEGVGVGPDGNVYVADTYSKMIRRYDPTGKLLNSWDGGNLPANVRVDSSGYVYSTSDDGGVSKFTSTGQLVKHFTLPEEGRTYGLALAPNGEIYVGSDSLEKIYRLSPSGEVLSQWGSYGTGNGQFDWVRGLAVDSSSNLYAVDAFNYRIQKFDAAGNYLTQWGAYYPYGICYSPSGYIFAAEEGGDKIEKFTTAGAFISTWGSLGLPAGYFSGCNDVAVDTNDNVYVADQLSCRICKFVPVQQTPGKIKALKDGDFVALSNQIVTATNNDLGEVYIEAADRSSGIRIITNLSASRWWKVIVMGTLDTVDGERVIRASSLTYNDALVIAPFVLTNKALGGGDLAFNAQSGIGQRGVEDGAGANNIGLLVKTSGKVTGVGSDFFYIDDGTHAHDGSIFVGVRVQCRKLTKPKVGANVAVTGISRINKIGDRYFRSIAARIQSDIALAQ